MRASLALLLLAACACLLGGAQGRALKDTTGQACLDGFKSWLVTPCTPTTDGDTAACCAPLVALGPSCWVEVLNTVSDDKPTLAAVIGLLGGCNITVDTSPGPTDGPTDGNSTSNGTATDSCAAAFVSTLSTACAEGAPLQPCCDALRTLPEGTACLEEALNHLLAPDSVQPFIALLDSCGFAVSTRSLVAHAAGSTQAGGDGTVATRLLPSSPAQDVSSMKEQTRLLLLPAVQRRG